MEMQINNPIIYFLVSAFFVWSVLGLIALALISLRKDKDFIYDDINKFLLRDRFEFRLISAITLFFILPISIPYSIIHFFRK